MKLTKWIGLLFAMLICTNAAAESFVRFGDTTVSGVPARWAELNAHDPAIFKDGDRYYAFSTDASLGDIHRCGVQVRASDDLISWRYVGTAFADFKNDCIAAIDHSKLDLSKHNGLWAPDVVKVGDTYRMYYSASTFGSSRSCIGLAQADKPEGPYTDMGIVIKSDAGALNGANCIDPALIVDKRGDMYMAYGSFFGGIFIVRLGADGFIPKGETPVRIAGTRGSSIEGSYIVYLPETDYYYLFVSYGSLSSDYNIRVARSKELTGPYLDAQGRDMNTYATVNAPRVGTKLLGGLKFIWNKPNSPELGMMAPGHCSVLNDGGSLFLVHHARAYGVPSYWFGMQIRRMALNKHGWPVVLPMRYTGEAFGAVDEAQIAGDYAVIEQKSDSNKQPHESVTITLKDGRITGAHEGEYRIYDGYHMSLTLDETEYDGVIVKQREALQGFDGFGFSVLSEEGLSVLGFTQY